MGHAQGEGRMSARKRKRIVLKQIRYNNSWNWRFEKFTRSVVAVSRLFSAKVEEVYAKARQERVQA
jgi:hypothetical protein